ncbi:hypothetical protein FNJ87_02055 [Nonlabens mediterrranea]|uniref:Uncharacterized protein n=1 Tax=Nonlabens mediterrranea TaxID=1419947 RepID=A0ABS0A2P6_9FLAO|nr:hypothetical protein [Nonlabens mediterrranea]
MATFLNNLFSNSLKIEIAELSAEVFEIDTKKDIKTDFAGIIDGKEIITDLLENNEWLLAFEHLKYVISELELKLNPEQNHKMNSISNKFSL